MERFFKVVLSEQQHALIETLLEQLVTDHAAGDDESHAQNIETLNAFRNTTEEVI